MIKVKGHYKGDPIEVLWSEGVLLAPDTFVDAAEGLFMQPTLDLGPLTFLEAPSISDEEDAAYVIEYLFDDITSTNTRLGYWQEEHGPSVDNIVKHASPTHPGTGTDQSVHGGGSKIRVPRPTPRPFDKGNVGSLVERVLEEKVVKLKGEGISLALYETTDSDEFTIHIHDEMGGMVALDGITHKADPEYGQYVRARLSGKGLDIHDKLSLAEFRDALGNSGLEVRRGIPQTPTHEQLQMWYPPSNKDLPSFVTGFEHTQMQDFSDARQVFFGTKLHTPAHSNLLANETELGQSNVAWLMENSSYSDRLETEIKTEMDNYLAMQHDFLDEGWEKVYGESSEGGHGTWRELMKPAQVEGQLGMSISDELYLNPNAPGFKPHTFHPDDPLWLDSWIISKLDTHETEFGRQLSAHLQQGKTGVEPNWYHSYGWGNVANSYYDAKVDHFDGIGIHSTSGQGLVIDEILHNFNATPDQLSDGEGRYDRVVQHLRNEWASSSSHPTSVAVQLAAEDTLGIDGDTDHFFGPAYEDGRFLYRRMPHLFEAYADSVYTNTQVRFENAGVTHVPLARGMGLNPEDLGIEDAYFIKEGTGYFEVWEDGAGSYWGDNYVEQYPTLVEAQSAITEMGGDEIPTPGQWHDIDLDLQPLSSFSMSVETALSFSRKEETSLNTMTRVLVPRERIWATSLDGFGSMRETEVIVLGGHELPAQLILRRASDTNTSLVANWDNLPPPEDSQ